ncbi:hypothetical protein GCM10008983_12890 [Lentibacillus halophilus]|uniref:DUF5082 domain-containing protein n=1 Tax=Lentibacillus halophilus TaxID=295065 RepID=A0ABN0Z8U3_9BACI
MKETLKQILIEMQGVRTEVQDLRTGQNELCTEVQHLRTGQTDLHTDVSGLKQGQKRLEKGQERLQKNLIDSLGVYTESIIGHFDNKTDVLNQRVFKIETEMKGLSKPMIMDIINQSRHSHVGIFL